MTNQEWLMTLSVDDLVEAISNRCNYCAYFKKGGCPDPNMAKCRYGNIEWLKAEHVPKLKPCPCCGGEAVIDDNDMSVYCNDCGMGTTWGATIEDAIKTWNRRVSNE